MLHKPLNFFNPYKIIQVMLHHGSSFANEGLLAQFGTKKIDLANNVHWITFRCF